MIRNKLLTLNVALIVGENIFSSIFTFFQKSISDIDNYFVVLLLEYTMFLLQVTFIVSC